MKIKDLCADERPREKFCSLGSGALSNGELLSVLLRSGSREQSALELAQTLLSSCGGRISDLSQMGVNGLSKIKGIGRCKALQILAAIELGRRFMQEIALDSGKIDSTKAVYSLMQPLMKGLDHEECWIILLSKSLRFIDRVRISSGSDNSTTLNVKQIIRAALDRRASCLVLVHNHPGGNPQPSEHDIHFTSHLHDAARSFEIPLIDHVIIAENSCYSFADEREYRFTAED
ncbi:MAG: DNA repair protein RadC [Bacteroidales bacterium]|nr:DNA repair protein RadC [Bacteroidales bacterium]